MHLTSIIHDKRHELQVMAVSIKKRAVKPFFYLNTKSLNTVQDGINTVVTALANVYSLRIDVIAGFDKNELMDARSQFKIVRSTA